MARADRPSAAERALLRQIAAAEQTVRLALGYRDGDPEGEPSARPGIRELVQAQAAVARLTSTMEQARAARLAGRERDPLRRIERLRDLAEQAGSWTAARQYGADALALSRQLEADRRAAALSDRVPATAEERAAVLSALVASASDDELEVCVSEWLKRRRYTLEVDEGGTLCLVPFGEDPGLRLVNGHD